MDPVYKNISLNRQRERKSTSQEHINLGHNKISEHRKKKNQETANLVDAPTKLHITKRPASGGLSLKDKLLSKSDSRTALKVMAVLAAENGEPLTKSRHSAVDSLYYYSTDNAVPILKHETWKSFFDRSLDKPKPKRHVEDERSPPMHPAADITENHTIIYDNDLERKCLKMVNRIYILWNELKIPSADRRYYSDTLCKYDANPTSEQCHKLSEYIVILNRHRVATIHVLTEITARENSLERLIEYLEIVDIDNTDPNETWQEEIVSFFFDLQISTMAIIRAIQLWRRNLWRPYPFIWKGINYLLKVESDLNLLRTEPYSNVLRALALTDGDLLCLPVFSPVNKNTTTTKTSSNTTETKMDFATINEIETHTRDMIFREELNTCARVIYEEFHLQESLSLERKQLEADGVFIPTLRMDLNTTTTDVDVDNSMDSYVSKMHANRKEDNLANISRIVEGKSENQSLSQEQGDAAAAAAAADTMTTLSISDLERITELLRSRENNLHR
eukprot:gene1773-3433_t